MTVIRVNNLTAISLSSEHSMIRALCKCIIFNYKPNKLRYEQKKRQVNKPL